MYRGVKRVLFFLSDLQGGGAEKAVVKIVQGFVKRGIATELLLLNKEGVYLGQIPSSCTVWAIGAGNLKFYPNYIRVLPKLVLFLWKNRPKVIVSNLTHLNVMALFAAWVTRISVPVIAVEHNNFSIVLQNTSKISPKFLPLLMRWLYPKASSIIGVSQGVVDDLKRVLVFDSSKFRVIYNPIVDEDLLRKAEEPVHHSFFGEGKPPVILAVGRLHVAKDFSTLLQAFALVRKEIDARLLILGEGEKRQELETLAQDLGIAQDLDMPGFVQNPYKYMKRASLFVLSSQWEGLP
ncbi:MAG: glycosyltransferase, partial [Candidatus Caldatribacterium sp.]|nr:glycosyltransferase [Candidatus Caldatribacterium sp.]